jgi:putative aldouronate transport system permease protein
MQLVLTLLAYFLVRTFFVQDLFSPHEGTSTTTTNHRGASWIGVVVGTIYAVVILFVLYLLFVHPYMQDSESGIGVGDIMPAGRFILFLVLTLGAVILNILITLTLAYPLTVKDLPGRQLYKGFLFIVILIGAGSISEYLMVRDMGMVSTIFPYLFLSFFNIVSVFVLKSIFNSKYSGLKEEASAQGRGELHSFFMLFIPKVWKPLIALGLLHFVMIWNSYTTSMIYSAQAEQFSPVHLFRVMSTSEFMGVTPGGPVILMLGAIVSLPGIVLLLVFRNWFTSEVMISQVRKL